ERGVGSIGETTGLVARHDKHECRARRGSRLNGRIATVLLLTEDDVRRVLTMEMALEAVEAGLRKLALDEAVNIPRTRCRTDHCGLHVLSAAAKTLGVLGYKAYVDSRRGVQFHVALYD